MTTVSTPTYATWSGKDRHLPVTLRRPLDICDRHTLWSLQCEWGMTSPYPLANALSSSNARMLRSDMTVGDASRTIGRRLAEHCAILAAAVDQGDPDDRMTCIARNVHDGLLELLGINGLVSRGLEDDRSLGGALPVSQAA